VDRSVDQIAPIIHEWTYDAMCHDLLDMEGNKHVIEVILFFFLILQLFSVSERPRSGLPKVRSREVLANDPIEDRGRYSFSLPLSTIC
jgi:hypothetical protein